jgi:hypothetical protein
MNKALIVEMVDSANKRCRRVSVLILFVAIAGCYVADRPLTPAGTKAPDGRLLGQWRCEWLTR